MPPSIITAKKSPNFNHRPVGVRPSLIVIHGTAGSDAGDIDWLSKTASEVSYHDLITEDGTIYRMVDPLHRAWHAGKSSWRGVTDVNDFSIGIGLSINPTLEDFEEAQYDSCGFLLAEYRRRFGIGFEQIVGHYHVSPGRKFDPWYEFEWGRLFARLAKYAGL